MKEKTQNSLPKSKLKERMNFASMFERQEQQIKQTAHIKNLLTPTQENQESKSFNSRIETLESQYSLDSINHRFDQLEENLKQKPQFKIDFNNKKMVYTISMAFIIGGLLFGIGLSSGGKTIIQEKVIVKEIPAKAAPVAIKKELFVMTKFVNIRSSASKNGNILTTLAPNSIVERLDQKRGWQKIKYTNHLQDKTLIGWAYGENLQKIK